MDEAIRLEKDTYDFQKARVMRLATELGKEVEFDNTVCAIKFRATDAGTPFKVTRHSGELEVSTLADKPDSWIMALILQLAGQSSTINEALVQE
jgi:hypothetical protein